MKIHNSNPLINLVFGSVCSGKGEYCDSLKRDNNEIKIISTSAIVRQLISERSRSSLVQTAHLDSDISTALINDITKYVAVGRPVVVDGIRQLSIVENIVDFFTPLNLRFTWLSVPEDIRKTRFEIRNNSKDDLSFEEACESDVKLGLNDIKEWLLHNISTLNVHMVENY